LIADPDRLRQVIWNLLSNAAKFTSDGGRIDLGVRTAGTTFELTVSDTGRGIDPEFLPYVFDRFKQADGSSTRRVGGLGLGLSIVRHLVELHGGQVSASSPGLGHGATFVVILPVRSPAPAAEQRPSEPESVRAISTDTPPLPSSLKGLRVLVVDDEEDARELVLTVLAQADAIVATAASVAEGIEALQRFRPDILVSDIGMPDEDGYSFMRRIKALSGWGGGIPSIALTAYTRNEDKKKALALGYTTHIGKPVRPEDLVAAVAKLAALVRR
jgi:CheY-like chemotaxis protein